MTRITAGEIEQVAQQHAAQMAAKRKQRSSWTPTGRASEEAIVEVELARRGLSDVSALGEFPGLGRVDISGNCLADLSGLSRCVELRWVKASANRLASTAGVGDATKLKALLLDHNIISELGAVSQLSALQTLDLSHNPLASPVEGLASLRGLATLVLSNCGLSSLPSLRGFERLTKLVLSSNSLQQLPDTPDSVELRELRLDGNRIRQAAGIVDPARTNSGSRFRLLNLSGNPLDDSAQTIESLSRACMQLEVLSLNTPVGVDAECLLESQWAAALHHLPRLKTVNGRKWKRDKAKAPAQSGTAPKAPAALCPQKSTAAAALSGDECSQLSMSTGTTTTTTAGLRAVLRGLSQDQLATLTKSLEAGVNLTKQLRQLHAAGSADAGHSTDVQGSRKRRLPSSSHVSDEIVLAPPCAAKKSMSAKKAAKRLTEKLGRVPTEAEIAALIAKRQKKAKKTRQ